MARGGPKSNTSIYHDSKNASPIFNMEDPYWQEFMAKNSKQEDAWRTPSMLAWNHRQHGLLGEIVDVEKMRAKLEQYRNLM